MHSRSCVGLFTCLMLFLMTLPAFCTGLSAVNLAVAPASPRLANTTITLTATPTGGSNVEYKFRCGYQDATGWHWSELTGYQSAATCSWKPDTARLYTLLVYARESGSTLAYQAYNTQVFTINAISSLIGRWETTCTGSPAGVFGLLITQQTASTFSGSFRGIPINGTISGNQLTIPFNIDGTDITLNLTILGNQLIGTGATSPFTFVRKSTNPVSPYTGKPTVQSVSIAWDSTLHEYVVRVTWDRPINGWDFYINQNDTKIEAEPYVDQTAMSYDPDTFTYSMPLIALTPLTVGSCIITMDSAGGVCDWHDPYGMAAWTTDAEVYSTTLTVLGEE